MTLETGGDHDEISYRGGAQHNMMTYKKSGKSMMLS
uniref:Uncharacterized protein n=1 Tax=Nelumbo nucifera TaxID=4432 RepID=A0A822YL59_NELNU|nr:TPA_asm: hypothetical protein HUJ06_010870 [Nelumbo nucifera]